MVDASELSGNGGAGLNAMFNELTSGSTQETNPTDTNVDSQQEAPTAEATQGHDEIEFEGKKYKIDKAAKDYYINELNAKKGMRKAFSERDTLKKQLEEVGKKGSKWDQVESVFKQKGVEGLYDILAGKEGSYKEYIKSHEDKVIRKYNATAEEMAIIEREEAMEKVRERADAAERLLRENTEKIQLEKDSANEEILVGKISSAFDKVSFEGKLGDAKKEEKFNKYVWEQARMQINEYVKDKNIEAHQVPGKVLSAIFEEVAADFSDAFKSQVETAAKAAISQKSEAATLSAQAKSVAGIRTNPKNLDELADKHNGNITSFIKELFGRSV